MAFWIQGDDAGDGGGEAVCRFAAEQSDQPVRLSLLLKCDPPLESLPSWSLVPGLVTLTVRRSKTPGVVVVVAEVAPRADAGREDEVEFRITADSSRAIPGCRVILRRSTCRVGTALIERRADDPPLRRATRAALWWRGWQRYSEVVGLKRFTSGKSGSDVVVFRPRMSEPACPVPPGSLLPGVLSTAWGSCLLVKTGALGKIREEWQRFQAYLTDRLHPFMSRSEELLVVHPARELTDEEIDAVSREGLSATVIGSFLGGDLLQAEPLEQLIQGSADTPRCLAALERLFLVLQPWYEGNARAPLGNWYKPFRGAAAGGDQPLKLFGKFDFTDRADRKSYGTALAWDYSFIHTEHLHHHLLGRQGRRDGLLYRLMEWNVRYSLVHGDLHVRNVLADRDSVWVLDFGETGVAPTLFDFAKLEVYLRLWCLRLGPRVQNFEDAAQQLEQLLLDHLTGSEAGLEPVRDLAAPLGTSPDELQKVAVCICAIRRHARRYSLGSPDCRDYLAVLYLTVLDVLRFPSGASHAVENHRLLLRLAWVLEDVLSRMAGLKPHPRARRTSDPRRLVTRQWLAHRGAPARIRYLMQRPEGGQALGPVAATIGVVQNANHHLDVFDHTLAVIAYLENLFDDPVAGFLDPRALDQRVADDLQQQGIRLPPIARPLAAGERTDDRDVAQALDAIRQLYGERLDENARLALVWGALLHDVGKPATRSLNAHNQKGEKVQFIGHELYGWQLVREFAAAVLPEVCPRDEVTMVSGGATADWRCPSCGTIYPSRATDLIRRVEYLVRRHHDHHTMQNALSDRPQLLEQLRMAVTGPVEVEEGWTTWGRYMDPALADEDYAANTFDFPLLLLHGYADVLACRGPDSTTPMTTVAARDLLLLAFYVQRLPEVQREQSRKEAEEAEMEVCRALTRGFNEELGIAGRPLGELLGKVHAWCRTEQAHRQRQGLPPLQRADALAKAREFLRHPGVAE